MQEQGQGTGLLQTHAVGCLLRAMCCTLVNDMVHGFQCNLVVTPPLFQTLLPLSPLSAPLPLLLLSTLLPLPLLHPGAQPVPPQDGAHAAVQGGSAEACAAWRRWEALCFAAGCPVTAAMLVLARPAGMPPACPLNSPPLTGALRRPGRRQRQCGHHAVGCQRAVRPARQQRGAAGG